MRKIIIALFVLFVSLPVFQLEAQTSEKDYIRYKTDIVYRDSVDYEKSRKLLEQAEGLEILYSENRRHAVVTNSRKEKKTLVSTTYFFTYGAVLSGSSYFPNYEGFKWRYNCKKRTRRLLETVEKLGTEVIWSDAKGKWEKVAPGSRAEQELNDVCEGVDDK